MRLQLVLIKIILFIIILSGCGQTGPLTLPAKAPLHQEQAKSDNDPSKTMSANDAHANP
jgi:predicted small lipoprotein YifL